MERPSQCEAAEGGSSFIGVALPIIGNCSLIPNVSPQIILYGSFPLTFDWDWTSTGERKGVAAPETHGKRDVGLLLRRTQRKGSHVEVRDVALEGKAFGVPQMCEARWLSFFKASLGPLLTSVVINESSQV